MPWRGLCSCWTWGDVRDGELILWVGVLYIMSKQSDIQWGEGWVWPVPRDTAQALGKPVITQEFRRPSHLGVDIMYRSGDRFVAPEGTPILAARSGTVWSTGQTARGWNVVVDHGPPFATFYQHLAAEPDVVKGDLVAAGQRIGVMGIDPTDGEGVRHLHFAVWYQGAGDSASVDPSVAMMRWAVLTA